MNSLSKKKKDRSPGALGAMGTGILIGSITPFILVISAVIVANTGIWWFPLLFGFLTVIGTPVFALFQRREKSSYHMLVGHEIYYSDNPGELKKALKKARKKGIPDGVRRKATYYRSRHDKVTPFTDIREQKRRRKAALLYMSAGITALLGVFMIWRAFPFPKDPLKDGLKTADFTSIFLIAGGIMAIITAVGLCLRKPVGVCAEDRPFPGQAG